MARLFRYPAGVEIEGVAYGEPIFSAPYPVTIDNTQYGPEICELWTPEQLATIGIKEVFADPVPDGMLSGPPEDREEATAIYRSWPHPRQRLDF